MRRKVQRSTLIPATWHLMAQVQGLAGGAAATHAPAGQQQPGGVVLGPGRGDGAVRVRSDGAVGEGAAHAPTESGRGGGTGEAGSIQVVVQGLGVASEQGGEAVLTNVRQARGSRSVRALQC